jgi:outer membrane protein assembly factor BamB
MIKLFPYMKAAGRSYRTARIPKFIKKPYAIKQKLINVTIITILVLTVTNCGISPTRVEALQSEAPARQNETAANTQNFLPVISNGSTSSPSYDWPMVAANPQRTSWTPEEVRGDLSLVWYHPIEPYIPYKIQPIAANGKIYVSTARGLYTFRASDGYLLWVFPTELPLGNSPTIATVNGRSIAFVGGYERKIFAIDANTGTPVNGYTPYEALAGFETNPLVISSTIYAGNRDGYFYALNAVTGSLVWKYKTNGSILYSAAYKNGVLYFASEDAYAYALHANNGSLVWKSQKLLGEGSHSFWPVIYTNKTTQKDYVIFTSGENYSQLVMSLTLEENATLFANIPVGNVIGPTSNSIPGDWVPGTLVMDASKITNYYQNRPDRRTVFVLDKDTGDEYTYDSNGDGNPEYAPFTWSGVTQAGTKYPPIVNGVDGVYYQATAYFSGGWISRGGPVGWKFGTQYISRVDGRSDGHASDEPMAYSSGGRLIYWVLCCDREAGSMDVTIPFNQPNRAWQYYGYNLANNNLAPGYQQMYDSGNSTAYNNLDGWQIYSGRFQSKNGVYGKHGTTQSPPIPYAGKLYFLKGNALLAFSPNGQNPKTPLPLAVTVAAQTSTTPPSRAILTERLETEVQKMLAAGPLHAGYLPAGFLDLYGGGSYGDERGLGEIFDYFQNPSDTVYTLLLAYPYLSSTTQDQVKSYLQTYYGPGATYSFTSIVHIGFGTGSPREAFVTPSEVISWWGQPYHSPLVPSTEPICGWCGYWQHLPPFSFYSAWKYAQVVGDSDPAFAQNIFNLMSAKIEAPPNDTYLIDKPYFINLYAAGYLGYLQLKQMAGLGGDSTVTGYYNHMLSLRVNNFTKDTPYPPIGGGDTSGISYNNTLAVARNFMFLTPELGEYLNQHILSQVQSAVAEYSYVAPYWFVSQFDDSYGEGTFQTLYDSPALFQAKAWILKQPYNELVKWLDVPAFYQGDLFYIQNLVAALNAN